MKDPLFKYNNKLKEKIEVMRKEYSREELEEKIDELETDVEELEVELSNAKQDLEIHEKALFEYEENIDDEEYEIDEGNSFRKLPSMAKMKAQGHNSLDPSLHVHSPPLQ